MHSVHALATRAASALTTRASLLATFVATAVLAVVASLAGPTPAAAQVPTLDRVDSLVTAGAYDDARTDLETWWSAREQFDVPGSDMARALMLRGRLAPDPQSAEPHYLSVVLGYPTSPYAPEALLRLGQGLLAAGEAARAAGYLERLVADYPGLAQRPVAQLWLARAATAARRPQTACRAAREGLQDARDSDLSAMLRVEEAASCAVRTAAETPPARSASEQARPERAAPEPAAPRRATPEPRAEPRAAPARTESPAASTGQGRWSVQTGAFRYRSSADALLERLRDAGYSPRLVLVPGSDLMRVRVGRYGTSGEATELLTRLRGQGFDAVVVSNATDEREP